MFVFCLQIKLNNLKIFETICFMWVFAEAIVIEFMIWSEFNKGIFLEIIRKKYNNYKSKSSVLIINNTQDSLQSSSRVSNHERWVGGILRGNEYSDVRLIPLREFQWWGEITTYLNHFKYPFKLDLLFSKRSKTCPFKNALPPPNCANICPWERR